MERRCWQKGPYAAKENITAVFFSFCMSPYERSCGDRMKPWMYHWLMLNASLSIFFINYLPPGPTKAIGQGKGHYRKFRLNLHWLLAGDRNQQKPFLYTHDVWRYMRKHEAFIAICSSPSHNTTFGRVALLELHFTWKIVTQDCKRGTSTLPRPSFPWTLNFEIVSYGSITLLSLLSDVASLRSGAIYLSSPKRRLQIPASYVDLLFFLPTLTMPWIIGHDWAMHDSWVIIQGLWAMYRPIQ